jgi:hypothetical protein
MTIKIFGSAKEGEHPTEELRLILSRLLESIDEVKIKARCDRSSPKSKQHFHN